jgi:iron-sulfur cluster repair protein YtfE (RIC family)
MDVANDAPSSAQVMTALMAEIVATHHACLRRDVPRLEALARDLAHPDAQEPALVELRSLFGGLWACVEAQLDKEEQVLFPMLARLEQQGQVSKCHAGMIRSRVMMAERDLARVRGVILRMKELASEHLALDARHELLDSIEALLADLREHTRKECDVLFAWAVQREAELAK